MLHNRFGWGSWWDFGHIPDTFHIRHGVLCVLLLAALRIGVVALSMARVGAMGWLAALRIRVVAMRAVSLMGILALLAPSAVIVRGVPNVHNALL